MLEFIITGKKSKTKRKFDNICEEEKLSWQLWDGAAGPGCASALLQTLGCAEFTGSISALCGFCVTQEARSEQNVGAILPRAER